MKKTWHSELENGIDAFIAWVAPDAGSKHYEATGSRVVRAFEAMVSGYLETPAQHFEAQFPVSASANGEGGAGMVFVGPIEITSTCRHHLLPIIGKAYFAYLPKENVLGLSKIPRFIDVLCRRLQVQEDLTEDILETFDTHMPNAGCAVWIRAYHCCMAVRGVKEHQAYTTTMRLRGAFFKNHATRDEFIANIDMNVRVVG